MASLADDTSIDRTEEWTDGWAAFAGIDDEDLFGASAQFTGRSGRLFCTRQGPLTNRDIPALLADPSGIAAVIPPFSGVHRAEQSPVTIANDWLGYRQLFWWRGPGVAAVSTSARALGALAGAGLDQEGLGAQAIIGWQIGDLTIFDGVRALPPASLAKLSAGQLTIDEYAPRLAQDGPLPRLDDAVEEMASILIEWQTNYVGEHRDSVLQLTGGHDSRILLGATPEKLRSGLRTLTIGDDDNPDVLIAGALARRYGMVHDVRQLGSEMPTPEAAHTISLAASRALECLTSPMALAPLLLVEAKLEQGHRLSGLGGECARGFYYTGQPSSATTSAALVQRLAHWRVFANEKVESAALTAEFFQWAQENTVQRMVDLFAPGDWLRATDDFYLYNRMYRWSGAHGSVAAVRRLAVNPMLDRRFVELAMAVEPALKRDSLLLGRLMTRLDPALAQIPLDSGLIPARLGSRDLATRLAITSVTARKATRKIRQRLARGRRPQLGAAEIAELVLTHWRAEPAACAPLYDAPGINRTWLDGLLAGEHTVAPTTMAYLVNLVAVNQAA